MKGYLMSLATMDEGGIWATDVIYVYDDGLNMYWISNPNVRHSKAIEQNNKVAGTITVSSQGEDNLGIQFEGVVEKLEGDRYDLAVQHYLKRKKPAPTKDEDVLEGDAWYILKPKKIELICERLYGFDKQRLDL